jgi:hypothetical protein
MKKHFYNVDVTYTTYNTISVEASDENEAKELAMQELQTDGSWANYENACEWVIGEATIENLLQENEAQK